MQKSAKMQKSALTIKKTNYRLLIMSDKINLTQLAHLLDMSKRTLYQMIRDGRFPVEPIKGTKPKLWLVSDVYDWYRNQHD